MGEGGGFPRVRAVVSLVCPSARGLSQLSWPRIFWDTFGNVMAYDILGYFWQCHGLGYFGILLAMSWPTIFWDTFGNVMA
jgi:hypothetical protein